MIANEWGMFEVPVNEAGVRDLPLLLQSIRSMTTLPSAPATPPLATPLPTPMDVQGLSEQGLSPSPIKKEASNEEPILIRVGRGKVSYSCPQCETITVSKNGCDAHIRAVHTGKTLTCVYCMYSSSNRDSLNRHQREHN